MQEQRETLVIQSDPDKVVEVDEWAERIAQEMGFSPDERFDIAISVTEAVNNAIVHGNARDRTKRVVIAFTKKENELEVSVRDEGKGFNHRLVADPTIPENLMKPSGRGILIIRTLMDDVHFRGLDEGMEVVMVKRRRRQ
jgi:serine/threonine-protein kinase RsbW